MFARIRFFGSTVADSRQIDIVDAIAGCPA